jgi:hypothetical protein
MNVDRAVASVAADRTLARIRQLAPETANPVRRQHLVSRVLLERFTEPSPGGPVLYPFDLNRPKTRHKLKGAKGVGWVENFVPYASGSLEQLWNDTEQHLPAVFAAVDAGTVLDHPAHIAMLRDLLALHLTRSRSYRDLHVQSFVRAYVSTLRRLTGELRDELRSAVLRERGLHVVGPGGIEYFAHRYLEPSVEMFTTRALLRARIEEIYAMARQQVTTAGLQIITPPDDSEFLIGDTPAFTRGTGPQGPTIRVALGDATTALLPLGPRHLLALSHTNETLTVPWPAVMEINILQILTAHDRVFLRPGSGLQELVRSVCYRREELRQRSATQETES